MMENMDDTVQAYIDDIGPDQRPLFHRIHRLILDAYPTVDIVLSYKMPTYKVDGRSLHVAAWRHGVSLYGWDGERDGASWSAIRNCRAARAHCDCGRRRPR